MPKSITSSLAADIAADVTTLVALVEIIRQDGTTYRMTNHDSDITFESLIYDHTIPFDMSANASTSTMSVDNTELTLTFDGTIFKKSDFRNGLFNHSAVKISLVNYEDPANGNLIVRTGWFGEINWNTNGVVTITVAGLLKILDFNVGRIYQPTCDTDLGSARCGVAINRAQAYDVLFPYNVGKWVYSYDYSIMTDAGLLNPSFESEVTAIGGDPITAWIQSAGAVWRSRTLPFGLGEASPDSPAPDGSNILWGGEDIPANSSGGFERSITQNRTTAAAGMSNTFIDAQRYFAQFKVTCANTLYLEDPFKLQMDFLDSSGAVIKSFDTDWITNRVFAVWQEHNITQLVPANTRSIQVYMWARLSDGTVYNVCFDDTQLWFWDHTLVDPYTGVVYKANRITNFSQNNVKRPLNGSWDAQGVAVANTNTDGAISNWTHPTTNDYWLIDSSVYGLAPQDGGYFLAGGDDASGVQKTYTLEQTILLDSTGFNLDSIVIDLGQYIGEFRIDQGFGDITSLWGYDILFLSASDVTLSTVAHALATGAVGWSSLKRSFAIPTLARKVTIRIHAQSPVGSSIAQAAFDNARFFFFDAEQSDPNTDPITGYGELGTSFNSTPGVFTLDGGIIWKALNNFRKSDIVASVTDSRQFVGTGIAGGDGAYETAVIEWVTGNNSGRKSIIRTWNSATKAIKLYFKTPLDIQVGDKFYYITPCHKRFTEDCIATFQNGINFQGFPHLPGKLRE